MSTMINYLKENHKLSDDELVNISSKCATFFAFSSAQKIQSIEATVNEFKTFIETSLVKDKAGKNIFSLLSKDFKDIIKNTPSFVTGNPESIKDTIRFLMGESLETITTDIPHDVKGLKGDFTSKQLVKIYSDSITALAIPPSKIGEFASNISRVYKNCYGVDLDMSKMINGRNFSGLSQLRNEDYFVGEKVEKIFALLKRFVSDNDMKNLLENNVSFLIASVDEVKNGLKNAILESRNQEELKANVLHKIKSHFGRYEAFDQAVERKESIVVDKLKKVSINDMEEESLVEILNDLDTTTQDIEKWKHNWSREEKEMRELQIQLSLEDMLAQLKDIDEMAQESVTNPQAFEEENPIIISLLNDVILKHSDLLASNKLNKNLKAIDAKVVLMTSKVIERINGNIDEVVRNYKEEIW